MFTDYPEFLTLEQAAEALQMSTKTFKRRIADAGVPYYRIGNKILINREEFSCWIKGDDDGVARLRSTKNITVNLVDDVDTTSTQDPQA